MHGEGRKVSIENRKPNRWPSCFHKGKDHLRMTPEHREVSRAKESGEMIPDDIIEHPERSQCTM